MLINPDNKQSFFNSGVKNVDIVRKIAQQWRGLTPEQKQVRVSLMSVKCLCTNRRMSLTQCTSSRFRKHL